jgi:hypothetical protein
MSGTTPIVPRSGIPLTTQLGGMYASQGMISPISPFVSPDGTLSPVAFRFLFSLLNNINALQQQVSALQTQVTTLQSAAGTPPA